MTSYLKTTGKMPFTGAEIAAEFGLPAKLAPMIDGIIARCCVNSSRPVMSSVWAVTTGDDFEQCSMHGTVAPVEIGAPYIYANGDEVRDCTYAAKPEAVAAVRQAVIKALDDELGVLAR